MRWDRTKKRWARLLHSCTVMLVPTLHTTLLMKTEVNPLVVYSTYMAVKLHFERGSYDAFKFNFKGPSRKNSAFQKSPDRFAYEKLAKKYPNITDLIHYLLANVLDGRSWIRDMNEEVYLLWIARMQRMQYQFNTDMNTLCDYAINHKLSFDDCLKPHPSSNEVPILELCKRGSIQVESVIIVDFLVGFLSRINKKTLSDPLGILSDRVYMMQQYKPFIVPRINTAAVKNIIINLFTDVNS